jgi:dihydrodipicolinate reductase
MICQLQFAALSFAWALCITGADILGRPKTSTGRVLVAGATGRVGRLVVQELLNRENSTVVVRALVRDVGKAKTILPANSDRLEIVRCELSSSADVAKVCKDSDAIIWCATGFSDSSSPIDKLVALFRLKFSPLQSIDIQTLGQFGTFFGKILAEGKPGGIIADAPQVDCLNAFQLYHF